MLSARIILWALALAALIAPQRAGAHAVLLDSDPAHRAVLAAAPARIVLRFNEPVTPIEVRVIDAGGRMLALPQPPRSVDREIHAALPPDLGTGTFVVSFRVTSADGHPVSGALLFAVGAAPDRWTAAAKAESSAWRWAAIGNRALHVLCLFLAAGGLLFARVIRRDVSAVPPGLGLIAALAAVTAATGIFLHGALVRGDGEAFGSGFWPVALATPQAKSAAVALFGLALAFVIAPRLRNAPARIAAVLGALIALVATGITGHSAAAGFAWWPVAALHLVAAGFWLGSLPPLLRALAAAPRPDLAPLLLRFSEAAVAAVSVLVLAGLALALQRLGRAEEFLTTDYGRLVLGKIAGAALLIGIAAHNKLRLTPAIAAATPGAAQRLRRSIAVELVLMAGIVGLAAILAHTDPHAGHAHHDHGTHDHSAHHHDRTSGITLKLEAGERIATVEIHPGKPGRNTLTVAFTLRGGEPLKPLEAGLELSLPSAGVEPFAIALKPLTPGTFAADISELALPGRWQIHIDALVSDFEKAIFRGEAEIK